MALRAAQLVITRNKIMEARIADGNEVPTSNDIAVDWMQTRRSGGLGIGYRNQDFCAEQFFDGPFAP